MQAPKFVLPYGELCRSADATLQTQSEIEKHVMLKARQKLPRKQLVARYHALFRLFNLVLLRLAVGGGMEPLFSSSLSLWLAFRSSSDDEFEL